MMPVISSPARTGFTPSFLLGTLRVNSRPLTADMLRTMDDQEIADLANHPNIQTLLMGDYQPCWLVNLGLPEEAFVTSPLHQRRYVGKEPANPHIEDNWLVPLDLLQGEWWAKIRLFVELLGVDTLVVKPHSYEWWVAVKPKEQSFPWAVKE